MQTDLCYRILVVDDEPGICNALVRVLGVEGRCFTIAHGTDAAIAILHQTTFDLIISDFKMPGKDGMSLMTYAKRHYPDTLRIMLSAYSDRKLLMDAVNRGSVFHFITKPWDDGDLKHSLRSTLEWRRMIGQNDEPAN